MELGGGGGAGTERSHGEVTGVTGRAMMPLRTRIGRPATHRRMMYTIRISVVALVVGALAACGGGSSTGNDAKAGEGSSTTRHTAAGVDAGVSVSGAWVRASIPGQDVTAAYMEIHNAGEADELIGATVSPDVAERVEIHETVAVDDDAPGPDTSGHDDHTSDTTTGHDDHTSDTTTGHDDHASDTTAGGSAPMMQMREVEAVPLPKGGAVDLEPGGLHMMVFGVRKPLEAGQKVEITLRFRHSGPKTVTAEVRPG